jgi:hypothetical protein
MSDHENLAHFFFLFEMKVYASINALIKEIYGQRYSMLSAS